MTFGKTRSPDQPGCYHVVFEYEQETVGLEAGAPGAHSCCTRCCRRHSRAAGRGAGRTSTSPRSATSFIRFAQRRDLGPSTAVAGAAPRRRATSPGSGSTTQSLIQFGHGRYQQRIQATITSQTPHIAVELASDKEETNSILGNLGLPVPQQRLVQTRGRRGARGGGASAIRWWSSPTTATTAAASRSTSPTTDQVRAAFARRRSTAAACIVESFITGHDHRMLVVNGELVAVAKRVPGHVVGDGVHTIEQLVAIVNSDPRRGIGHEKVLTRLEFDSPGGAAAGQAGLPPDHGAGRGRGGVPALDRQPLHRRHRRSTSPTSCIPTTTRWRCAPVKAIGLDVGGVDFLTPDITVSYKENGGAICEVNAAPGFRMHMAPERGQAARRGGPGDRHAVPAGHARPHPDRGDHRHQRQDHHRAHAGAHPQAGGQARRAHHHRRRLHRRPAHREGRHDRPGGHAHGARATRTWTWRCWRRRAAGCSAPAWAPGSLRRGRGAQRAVRPPRAPGHRHAGGAGPGQADRGRGGAATPRCSTPTTRCCLEMADYTEAKHLCYVTHEPGAPAGAGAHPRRRTGAWCWRRASTAR